MIKSLAEINEEFRAEMAAASSSARDTPTPGENDGAAVLASSLSAEAGEGTQAGRKLPRYAVPLALVLAALVLVFIAALLGRGGPPSGGNAPEGLSGAQGVDESGADAFGADTETGESGGAAEQDADEYNSASESLENGIDAAREAGGADEGADLSGVAALYGLVMDQGRADEVVREAEAGALPPMRTVIDRIDARFSVEAGGDAPALPPDETINSDLTFTSLTEPANALIDAINAGALPADRLAEVVDLRRRAYEIYPVRALKKLLATDCEDLGFYCAAAGRPAAEVFDAFVRAIEYRAAYLRDLPREGEDRRAGLRRVGRAYAEIAKIDGLGAERKRHAALLADCFYEMAAR